MAVALLMAFMHSVWQSALLLLLYTGLRKSLIATTTPLFRRNLLLLTILLQMIITVYNFYCYTAADPSPGGWVVLNTPDLPEPVQSWAPFFILGYLIWVGIQAVRLLLQWSRFKRQLQTNLVKPGIDLRLFADEKAALLGISRKVKIWLSEKIQTPLTFGWLKPVVILPVALVNQLSVAQTEALLLHELSHIRVHDYFYNWLLTIVEMLFFFNPFLVKLCREARLEREKQCDATVLQFKYPAIVYAEGLLLAAQMRRDRSTLLPAAVTGKGELLARIRFFTDQKSLVFSRNILRLSLAVCTILLAAVVAFTGGSPSAVWADKLNDTRLAGSIAIPGVEANWQLKPAQTITLPVTATTKTTITTKRAIEKKILPSESIMSADLGEPIVLRDGFEQVGFNTSSDLQKEIIIEETVAGTTQKALRVFLLRFHNGQWQLIPQLIASSQNIKVDTMLLRADSLQLKTLQQQQ
jgi:beta-lactamase regulating signal transducer with metallopeptidase domain